MLSASRGRLLVPRGLERSNPKRKPFMKFVSLGKKRAHRQGKLDTPPRAILEPTKPIAAPHQIHTYTELRQRIPRGPAAPTSRIGTSQTANPQCVIPTRHASWSCLTSSHERNPTNLSLLVIAPLNRDKPDRRSGGIIHRGVCWVAGVQRHGANYGRCDVPVSHRTWLAPRGVM